MRKKYLALVSALAMCCAVAAFAACEDGNETLASVTITNKTELTALWRVGDADRTVEVALSPESFTTENTELTVTSENTSVITVEGYTLTAVAPGTSTVTVTAEGLSDEVEITVSEPQPVLNAVAIANEDKLAADWYPGEGDRTVEVSYDPSEHFNSDNTPATVTSDNEDVIAVDGMKLTAKAAGTAKITVTAGGKTNEVTLTVKPVLTSLTITNKTELSAAWPMNGGEREVAYEYFPANFEGAQVSIVSGAPEVVEVKDGKLIAKGVGEATITVTVKTDEPREKSATDSVTVTVSPVLNTVTIANEEELAADWYLGEGDRTVEVSYDPAEHFNADNTPATVTSDNEDVIAVDGMKLAAKAAGTAKITVTAGGKTDEVTLTVKPVLTSLTITNKTELSAAWPMNGGEREVAYEYFPANFEGAQVSIVSGAPEVVEVKDGKLIAKGVGEATITVTVKTDEPREKSATDSVTVTVSPVLNTVTIANEEELAADWYLGEGDRTVEVSYDPAEHFNADNTPATVTSDNEDVIAVDGMKLTAKAAGTAKITVTAGGKTDEVTLTVKPVLTSLTITNKTELSARWAAGDADRTLSVTYAPEGFAGAIVSYSSSAPDIISVDEDGKLTAKAAGTATITVTVKTDEPREKSATDSIEITVLPTLSGISVLNEETLKGRWIVGEADRTVEIGYAPAEHYNAENTPATVTSDNEDVIAVDGMKLTAKGAGAAKITVTAGGKTAVVEIVVIPELTDVTIAGLNAEETLDYQATKQFTISPADSANYTFEQAGIFVVSDNTGIVTLTAGENGSYTLNAVGVGETTITVTARNNITKTIRVTVVPTAPMLTVETNALEGLEDTAFRIPTATAATCDGTGLSYTVTVFRGTNGGGAGDELLPDAYNEETGEITVSEAGGYSIVYTATDPRDADASVSQTVVFTAYRKVFAWQNGTFSVADPYVSDAEQFATTTNTSYTLAQFNMEASTLYYVEVTYDFGDNSVSGNNIVGLAHFMYENDTRFFSASVDRGDHNFKFKDSEGNERWNLDNALYSYRLSEYRGIEDSDANEVTFAIARDEDFFYAFVNGQYVGSATDADYQNVPTIPGIFGHAINNAQMKNIVYMSGEDAQTKINTLLAGGAQIGPYCPDTGWASGSLNSFDSAVTSAEGTSKDGISFGYTLTTQGANSGMIGPYVWVDGNFCIEWVYQNTAVGDGSGEKFMCLQVRRYDYSDPILQFGQRDSDDKFLLDKRPEASGTVEGGKWNQPAFSDFDFSQGARYKLERILHDDHAEYILTVTSVANPEQTHTRTITLYADEYAGWADPVLFYWKNTYSSGEYSQMKWYVPDTQTADGEV